MRTPCSEMYLFFWILTYLKLESQGTMIWKYFTKVTVSSPTPPTALLLEAKPGVRNKFLCGTHCLQYKCQCTSFVYASQTKSCNMYSRKLEGNYGGLIGYTKNTECAMTIPSVENGAIVKIEGCHVSVTCKTGYTLIGESTIQCTEKEGWNAVPNCELITCPMVTEKYVILDGTTYFWVKTTGITLGDRSVYFSLYGINEHICHTRYCQSDGSWSPMNSNGFSTNHCADI